MTVAQILAVVIFVAMFGLIVSEKIERHLVSLGCGLLMIVLVFGLSMHSMPAIWNTLALRDFFTAGFWYQAKEAAESSSGINWATILFIAGMMIMVEGMGRAGFFRSCLRIAKAVKYRNSAHLRNASILAMFIDSITVIFWRRRVELARLLKFNPVQYYFGNFLRQPGRLRHGRIRRILWGPRGIFLQRFYYKHRLYCTDRPGVPLLIYSAPKDWGETRREGRYLSGSGCHRK
ncbi:MAG: SLC13 family permease [Eisenbergiella massiliensis]